MGTVVVEQKTAKVFDIQRWSLHDGPGIRTVVFLKGCPLRCLWCSNPESQEVYNEVAFFKDKCIACFRCVENCPHNAITIVDGLPSIDRAICRKTCYATGLDEFPCTKECYSQALRAVAKTMTVEAVMKEVLKDELIYKQSEVGGLTVSGGEPLSQAKFVRNLFIAAKQAHISTAIETSGFATWETVRELIPHIDYFYLDLKAFDTTLHMELMGVPNEQILSNAKKIASAMAEQGKVLTVRIPVIPTFTEFEDYKNLLKFIHDEMGSSVPVELMAYHRLGRNKYADIGKPYELFNLEPFKSHELEPYYAAISACGLTTHRE